MNIKKPYAALAVLVLLTACSVGPNFNTPAAPTETAYTAENEALPLHERVEMGKQLEAQWWTLFKSDALNGIIGQVLTNNQNLAAAQETLAQTEEAVQAENGRLMPQVSLEGTAGRQKYGVALFGPGNFKIPPFSYYEAGPIASWSLDLFNGKHRALERQRALANYQAHKMDAAYLRLTGEAVATVLDIAAANAEQAAVARMMAEDRKTLTLVREAFAAGSATRTDILNASNQLVRDQAELPAIAQRASASRHALSILAGKAPANWTLPALDLHEFTLPQQLPVSLPSVLVKNRPDILAAEANLHAASAAIGVATANLYPQLTLSANMLQEALTPAGLFSVANNAWSVAAGLTAPIFNGGTLTAEKRAAEHAYQASLAQYRQTILEAFRQVADALTSLAHDDEAVTLMNNAANSASASLSLNRVSYQVGETGLLQVLDAQRALAQAELGVIRASHQRYVDSVRLFVAVGGSPMANNRTTR